MVRARHAASRALGAFALAAALSACAGAGRLDESVDAIHRDYAELQDRAVLRNILRRSVGLPAHFTSLTTVRGRDRINGGASLKIPFGGAASPSFELSPNVDVEQGPNFEVSTQANKEFFRGYLAPVGARTLDDYARRSRQPELVLSLFVARIELRERDGSVLGAANAPERPAEYARFRQALRRLLDQGLTTEDIEIVEDVGPPLREGEVPGVDQLLAVRDKGFVLEKADLEASGAARLQLRRLEPAMRFCFARASAGPYALARCRTGTAAAKRRFGRGDAGLFGVTADARAVLDAGDEGHVEVELRSLAGILDYLGAIVRAQSDGAGTPITVDGDDGPMPILVVRRGAAATPPPPSVLSSVALVFQGARYWVPTGRDAGHSGAVLTLVSQLLAQAQSVRDLPASNTVTIVGD